MVIVSEIQIQIAKNKKGSCAVHNDNKQKPKCQIGKIKYVYTTNHYNNAQKYVRAKGADTHKCPFCW